MKRRTFPFASLLVVLAMAPFFSCSQSNGQGDPITDLKAVAVVVNNSDGSLSRVGLDSKTLQTEIELNLRLAGLTVSETRRMTNQELLDAAAKNDRGEPPAEAGNSPFLQMEISFPYTDATAPSAISITLKLKQQVQLPPTNWEALFMFLGANALSFSATTWEATELVYLSGSRPDQTKTATKNLINRFLNDYLAKNPHLIGQRRTLPYGLESSDTKPEPPTVQPLSWDPSHVVYTSYNGTKYYKRLGETDVDVIVRVLMDSVAAEALSGSGGR